MSKLANRIALFCSHDNTGYLMKYTDPLSAVRRTECRRPEFCRSSGGFLPAGAGAGAAVLSSQLRLEN
jgi:hypothetical protein